MLLLIAKLDPGQFVLVLTAGKREWTELLIAAKARGNLFACLNPNGRMGIVDFSTFEEILLVGGRGGLPRTNHGDTILKFDGARPDGDVLARIMSDGVRMVARERQAKKGHGVAGDGGDGLR